MKEQINWYTKKLFNSIFLPIFLFLLFYVYINSPNMAISGICPTICDFTKGFPHIFNAAVSFGDLELLIISYVVIVLYTYPFESGTALFELSLPYSRTQTFVSKYIAGAAYLIFIIPFTNILSKFIIYNYAFGLLSPFLYLYLLSIIIISLYFYGILILFGIIFKRSIGIILGIMAIIIINNNIIFSSNIPLPPNIYQSPLYPLSTFINNFWMTIIFTVVVTIIGWLLYRRVEL